MYGSDADDVYRIGYDVKYILLMEGHLKRGVLFSTYSLSEERQLQYIE